MKYLSKIFCIITTLSTSPIFTSQNKINIRRATLADLDAISTLSHHEYHNTFKPMWLEKYAPTIRLEQSLDDFINEKITATKNANEEFINRQANHEEYGLLVATLKDQNAPEKVVGYCRFKKENAQSMYMNFILVDEFLRKQGIGKQLIIAAINTYDGITECNFRALIHNDFINDLYTKQGCVQKGTVSLDPNTGRISTDPHSPATHFDWTFPIRK